MMSQLQEVRTGQTTASVPEDDAASFRSDDSGDSEAFVVINQVHSAAYSMAYNTLLLSMI